MNTGHPSKAALGAARIALLAGVSAAAIFAASSANAQTTPSLYNPAGNYSAGDTGIGGNPLGFNLANVGVPGITTIGIPGLGYSTTPQVLEAGDAGVGAAVTTATPNVLNADGTPAHATYTFEVAAAAPNTYWTGTTGSAEAGKVLVNTSTGALATQTLLAGIDPTGAVNPPAGYSWVDQSTQDKSTNALYHWVPAQYQNDTAVNVVGVKQFAGGFNGGNNYLIDNTGHGVTNWAADVLTLPGGVLTATQQNYLDSACGVTGSATACTAAVQSLGGVFANLQAVSGNTIDPALVAATNITNNGVMTNTTNGTVTVNRGATASTTSLAGGVVYANNAGQYTAIGPDGMIAYGGTVVTTNGTAKGTTILSNGDVTIGNSLRVLGPTGGYAPSTVDMGGNRVQDVAAPIAGTDATNKAYVDKGLNKAYEGTAIALAISQPVFLPGQTFAMRGGWGGYEGQNAFGVSAAGIVAHNVFGYGSTVALDGGIGVGSNNGGVAGKAGVTVGFGGGSAPLK